MRNYVDYSQLDKIHDKVFHCCQLLQEQADYLLHLSVDDLQSNRVLYEKIVNLNARLRLETYSVLKGLKSIAID